MRRSVIFTCLLDLEPVEFGRLETCPIDYGGAVVTAACNGVPVEHKNQYTGTREWLDSLPGDREPGWLRRYAETLLISQS
jgi:hypothetical protein